MAKASFNEINRILEYDEVTGNITRKINSQHYSSGDVAGWVTSIGYRAVSVNGKTFYCHRIAYLLKTGHWPKYQIDHINHIRTDNRWENLREVTRRENQRNVSLPSHNKSGHVGVFWNKQKSKWQARIIINNKQIHLGFFAELNNAIDARKNANIKYGFHKNHGLNKPKENKNDNSVL